MKKVVFVVSWLFTMWTDQPSPTENHPDIKKETQQLIFTDSTTARKSYDSLIPKAILMGGNYVLWINDTTTLTNVRIEPRTTP